MTNQEIVNKVNEWQNADFVHPLTCGKDSRHKNLVPKEAESKIILACPDCDYIQDNIPEAVLSNHVQDFKGVLKDSTMDRFSRG